MLDNIKKYDLFYRCFLANNIGDFETKMYCILSDGEVKTFRAIFIYKEYHHE